MKFVSLKGKKKNLPTQSSSDAGNPDNAAGHVIKRATQEGDNGLIFLKTNFFYLPCIAAH